MRDCMLPVAALFARERSEEFADLGLGRGRNICYANISVYAEKAMLDWVLGGASPTRPTAWSIGLSVGTPSSVSGSEIATASGYTRQTCTFGAAASPAGSASNANAMTFGPFSTGCTVQGLQIWDTISATVGNMLWYGTLATARTLGAGDSLVINAGALTTTLS